MRVIGLLGGMSWESSIVYEQIINEEVRRRLGGVHSADLIIRSYDFADIERLQSSGDWEQAGALLADGARTLQAAGAKLLVLCTNTMHTVAEVIAAAVDVPLIHIADPTAAAIKAAGLTTWCAISGGACWPGGLAGVGYRSAARSETRPATAM